MKSAVYWTPCFEENCILRNILLIFWPEIPGISFYLCNKYVKEIREVHNQKVLQNSAVKLFWNFDNEML